MDERIYSRIGYQLKRAQHGLRLAMDSRLRTLRLTTPQYAVLANLRDNPGASGARLARDAFVTAQTMNEIVSGLEVAGLITRRASPSHGRIIESRLTSRGANVLKQADTLVSTAELQLVANLDRAERKTLLGMLGRCADSISAQNATGRRLA